MRILHALHLLFAAHTLARQTQSRFSNAQAINHGEINPSLQIRDLQNVALYRRTSRPRGLSHNVQQASRPISPAQTRSDPPAKDSVRTPSTGRQPQPRYESPDGRWATSNPSHGAPRRQGHPPRSGSQMPARSRSSSERIRFDSAAKSWKTKKPEVSKHISKESSRLMHEESVRYSSKSESVRSRPQSASSRLSRDQAKRYRKLDDDSAKDRSNSPSPQAPQIGNVLSSGGNSPKANRRGSPSEIAPGPIDHDKDILLGKQKSQRSRSTSPANSVTSIASADSSSLTLRKLRKVQKDLIAHAGRQRVYDEANDGARKLRWTKTCAHAITATGICLSIPPHIGFKIAGGGLAVAGIYAHHSAMTYSNSMEVKNHMDSTRLSDQEAYVKGRQVIKQAIKRPSESVVQGTQEAGKKAASAASSCWGATCKATQSLYNYAANCVGGMCKGGGRTLHPSPSDAQQTGLDTLGTADAASSNAEGNVQRAFQTCVGAACNVLDGTVKTAASALRASGLRPQLPPSAADDLV